MPPHPICQIVNSTYSSLVLTHAQAGRVLATDTLRDVPRSPCCSLQFMWQHQAASFVSSVLGVVVCVCLEIVHAGGAQSSSTAHSQNANTDNAAQRATYNTCQYPGVHGVSGMPGTWLLNLLCFFALMVQISCPEFMSLVWTSCSLLLSDASMPVSLSFWLCHSFLFKSSIWNKNIQASRVATVSVAWPE